MNRLERRVAILSGKRGGTFHPNQYWIESARRARVARSLRTRLRVMQPVVLLTPRWSSARRFLDDLATDLMIDEPEILCRTLDCTSLQGLTQHQAWAYLVDALTELSGVRLGGPAWQAVSRSGFRSVVDNLLEAMQEGPRRCLMLHAIQHIPFEAFEDLIVAFEAYRDRLTEPPRFNVVVAGTIAGDLVRVQGAGRPIVLPDYTHAEAVEALVEDLGPMPEHQLSAVVDLVGGVPAVLETLAQQGREVLTQIVADPDSFWQHLGTLAAEIRGAFDIVASDQQLHHRLERLAADGPLPEHLLLDRQLLLAGMVIRAPQRLGRQMQMRSPVFSDYALNH